MKQLLILALAFLGASFLADTAWPKGAITKIVIDSERMSQPVVITDREILDQFTIWSGPGVGGWDMVNTIPPPGTPKFIIDWTIPFPKVTLKERDPHRYLVRMYIEGRKAPRNTYEVLYEVYNKAPRGYVYLPSYPNDGFGQWNTFQISRGVEGSWFYATKEWDEVVRPLMGKE